MKKINDVLLLVAGLALMPFVSDLIGGPPVAMYITGAALAIVGIMGLVNK